MVTANEEHYQCLSWLCPYPEWSLVLIKAFLKYNNLGKPNDNPNVLSLDTCDFSLFCLEFHRSKFLSMLQHVAYMWKILVSDQGPPKDYQGCKPNYISSDNRVKVHVHCVTTTWYSNGIHYHHPPPHLPPPPPHKNKNRQSFCSVHQ